MRIFVRILLGVVALLAVLVVGAAVVIATIDKRALLAPLEARLEKATGREVTVGGEPRIDLSLTPTLVLEDVAIANAPWGSAKEMLRAKRVEAQVALLPLLSRRIELMRFTLVEPSILLETDRSGAGNWSFGTPAAAPAAPADATAASAFALGEVVIERGEVRYRDGRTGEATPIVVERLYVRGRDPQQPLVAQFRGRVANLPVDVEGTFGPLAALQAGRWPWPVSLEGEVAGRRTGVQAKVRPDAGGIAAGDVVLARGASRMTGSVAYQPREGRKPLWRFDLA
ncbi:MAG: AsmA family protein, partial [Burkholderiales bacterium]|nr:AsmA family protein [Burkholderiales bacterium]